MLLPRKSHSSLLVASAVVGMIQPILATNAVEALIIGPSIVEISPQYNNVFPFKNFNRNVSVPFWETSLLNGSDSVVIDALSHIANASFIAYDAKFYDLLGVENALTTKDIELVFTFPEPPSYAQRQIHDGTVYVDGLDTIFFAELYSPKSGFSMQAVPFIWQVTGAQTELFNISKAYPDPPLTIANGACYHQGNVFWAQEGNSSVPGGIVRMTPSTLKTEVVQNNYYGHRFNSPNDIVISNTGIAYFTDGYYGWDNFKDSLKPELANGVYRWDMNTGNIRMVAGAADGTLYNPNGLALSPDQTKLYVTSRGNTSADPWGQRNIYLYDVTDGGLTNRRLFAYLDAGFADGIKTDRNGRVYGAVTGSVDVFDAQGTLMGRIKVAKDDVAVNMIWVGSWLYIVGREHIYRVNLNTTGS